MRYLFVFWILCSSLFASTIVTENDPSTLVEGVSVISGDLYTFEEDLVVPGKEPLRFRRSFVSSIGNINPFPHLVAVLQVVGNHYVVAEPSFWRREN